MIEFCDLKQCEECENEYTDIYMHTDNFCEICYANLLTKLDIWKKLMEGGEDND